MRREILTCAALFLLSACGSPEPEAPVAAKTSTPEERLYEALRAGTYQANAALEAIRDADERTKPLSKETEGEAKDAMLDLLDDLDASGRFLADHVEEPDRAKVAKDFGTADDERLDAIEDLGKAKEKLTDALDIAKELEKVAPEEIKDEHATITASIQEAADAVGDGIGELKKIGP
ncbi:hypothetical protein BH11ARM2_BH11ARM2_32900 [soil metagenome]